MGLYKEMAVGISNDSDLELPIEMTRTRLGKEVGVIGPDRDTSFELRRPASLYRPLRGGPLSASLFLDTLSDAQAISLSPLVGSANMDRP